MDFEERSGDINFIPCVKWLRRGVSKVVPDRIKLTKHELCDVINQATEKREVELKKNENADSDLDMKYDLNNYDDEEDEKQFLGIDDLIVGGNEDDPYLINPDQDDDASDCDDLQIKPTDNLLLVAHVETSSSVLEVFVYNDVEDDLYVHHDILLPSFPLCLEWLSYEPGETTKGSLVAVGYMDSVIDVWDLDIIDCLEPAYKLGKKARKKKRIEAVGHCDAVLSLAWNHHVEHVLASGSVDRSVILWDLSQGSVASRLSVHQEKVQTLQWHPFEIQTLATGCCDKYVRVFDCRSKDCFKSWSVSGEVEKVQWNHFDPFTFLASTNTGYVHSYDVRTDDKKPIWTLNAHDQSINGMTLSSQCKGCLITASTDKSVKVWDISPTDSNTVGPVFVYETIPKLGLLHCVEVCPDAPFVVGIGGDLASDNLKIWDIREASAVRRHFGSRPMENPCGFEEFEFKCINDAEVEARAKSDSDEPKMSQKKFIPHPQPSSKAAKKSKKKKKRNQHRNL